MSLTEESVALDNTRWEGGRIVADLLDPDLYRRNPLRTDLHAIFEPEVERNFFARAVVKFDLGFAQR